MEDGLPAGKSYVLVASNEAIAKIWRKQYKNRKDIQVVLSQSLPVDVVYKKPQDHKIKDKDK